MRQAGLRKILGVVEVAELDLAENLAAQSRGVGQVRLGGFELARVRSARRKSSEG